MEIFLIKFGYHNEYHVENLVSIFLIFTPTCGQVEILVAIWLHDASKKIASGDNCSIEKSTLRGKNIHKNMMIVLFKI
jgi:hypothetical protein